MNRAPYRKERSVEGASVEGDEAAVTRKLFPELRQHFLFGAPDDVEESVGGFRIAPLGGLVPDATLSRLGVHHGDHDDLSHVGRQRPALFPSKKIFVIFGPSRKPSALERIELEPRERHRLDVEDDRLHGARAYFGAVAGGAGA